MAAPHTYKLPSAIAPSMTIAEFEQTSGMPIDQAKYPIWLSRRINDLAEPTYIEDCEVVDAGPVMAVQSGADVDVLSRLAALKWEFSIDTFMDITTPEMREVILDKMRSRVTRVRRGAAMILVHEYAETVIQTLKGNVPIFHCCDASLQPPAWIYLACVLVSGIEGARLVLQGMAGLCPQIENLAVEHPSKRTVEFPNGTTVGLPPSFLQIVAWLRGCVPTLDKKEGRNYREFARSPCYADLHDRWATVSVAEKSARLCELLLRHMGGFQTIFQYLVKTNNCNGDIPQQLATCFGILATKLEASMKSSAGTEAFVHFVSNPLAIAFSMAAQPCTELIAVRTEPTVCRPEPTSGRSESAYGRPEPIAGRTDQQGILDLPELGSLLNEYSVRVHICQHPKPEMMYSFFDNLFYNRLLNTDVMQHIVNKLYECVAKIPYRIALLCVYENCPTQMHGIDAILPVSEDVMQTTFQNIDTCTDRILLTMIFFAIMHKDFGPTRLCIQQPLAPIAQEVDFCMDMMKLPEPTFERSDADMEDPYIACYS